MGHTFSEGFKISGINDGTSKSLFKRLTKCFMGASITQFNVNAWMDLDCKFYDFCFVVAIHVASLNSHTKVHAIYKPFRLDARLICY